MRKRSLLFTAVLVFCGSMQPASAQRYTPNGLCALANNLQFETITRPISIASQYSSGSTQSISITVGAGTSSMAADQDVEYVVILLDTNNDGVPDTSTNAFCNFNASAAPPGCTVTQNFTLPTVSEDTTFGGRVMLSFDDVDPANGCGDNTFGDSEDFVVVVDVQEFITLADVSAPEDGGLITVSATLSHDVRDGSGFAPFTVDYTTADGTATTADGDYTAASGTLTFNGQAGDVQTFTVSPSADIVPEGDQTILVSLLNLSNATHAIDISDTATLTLSEDDTEVSLTMAKSVDNMTPSVGSTVTFTLQVSNGGPDAAVGAYVVDTLPTGFSSVTLVSAPAGTNFAVAGNDINWTGIDIPNGGSVTATFSAVVLPP